MATAVDSEGAMLGVGDMVCHRQLPKHILSVVDIQADRIILKHPGIEHTTTVLHRKMRRSPWVKQPGGAEKKP